MQQCLDSPGTRNLLLIKRMFQSLIKFNEYICTDYILLISNTCLQLSEIGDALLMTWPFIEKSLLTVDELWLLNSNFLIV